MALDNKSTYLVPLASSRVKITLGSLITKNTANAVPERGIPPPCLLSLPTEEVSESLANSGYEYMGAFRALSELQRRLDFATGWTGWKPCKVCSCVQLSSMLPSS